METSKNVPEKQIQEEVRESIRQVKKEQKRLKEFEHRSELLWETISSICPHLDIYAEYNRGEYRGHFCPDCEKYISTESLKKESTK